MKYIIFSFVLFSYLALFIGMGYSDPKPFPVLPPAYDKLDDGQDRKTILNVIEQESTPSYVKDFDNYTTTKRRKKIFQQSEAKQSPRNGRKDPGGQEIKWKRFRMLTIRGKS